MISFAPQLGLFVDFFVHLFTNIKFSVVGDCILDIPLNNGTKTMCAISTSVFTPCTNKSRFQLHANCSDRIKSNKNTM